MIARGTTSTAVRWVAGLLLVQSGCQPSQSMMSERLNAQMAMIDFSGLAPARPVDPVHASAAIPRSWELLPAKTGTLFAQRQWRNPARSTAVGIVHIRMPLPMSAKTLLWLAKSRYNDVKQPDANHKVPGGQARVLRQWSDPVGREWVEAENEKYRVRGYAVTCGFEGWFVYAGHKRKGVPSPVDLDLADRSLESVVPDALAISSR